MEYSEFKLSNLIKYSIFQLAVHTFVRFLLFSWLNNFRPLDRFSTLKLIQKPDTVIPWVVVFHNIVEYPINAILTGCSYYYIRITFPDGASETLNVGWCGMPTTSLAFTNHSNPKAGVFYAPGEYDLDTQVIDQPVAQGIYLLVSENEFHGT